MIHGALKNPYAVVIGALTVLLLGAVALTRIPTDILPTFKTPALQVLALYPGMPAEVMERDITSRLERWTGQSNGMARQESRSMIGVSVLRDYFRPDIDPNTAMSQVAALAISDMYYLPPGTVPPMVMLFDAVPATGERLASEFTVALESSAQYLTADELADAQGLSEQLVATYPDDLPRIAAALTERYDLLMRVVADRLSLHEFLRKELTDGFTGYLDYLLLAGQGGFDMRTTTPLFLTSPGHEPPVEDARTIALDIDHADLLRDPQVHKIIADLLTGEPRPQLAASRTQRWHAHNAASNAEAAKERETVRGGERIHAALLFDTLHRLLPERSVVVDEIIAQVPAMIRHLFRDRDIDHIRGWAGALGTGLPTALGVKLARPDDVVVCVIGDGAFSYNPVPASLGLAQQYRVPVLVVICNNQGYVSQEWNLYKYFPSGYALRDNNPYGRVIEPTPDYAAIAPAFGAHGECVTDPAQLEPAIRRGLEAVAAGRLALLDVRLEP